ncbi:MAG: PP0621 family protein [Halarcobacter sp.]
MIFKVLAILAVLFLVYIVMFKKDREKEVNKKEDEKIEDIMVECPSCGTYVSKKEAIISNGKFFCSKECL